jgi:hypothetical protein
MSGGDEMRTFGAWSLVGAGDFQLVVPERLPISTLTARSGGNNYPSQNVSEYICSYEEALENIKTRGCLKVCICAKIMACE